MRGCVLCRRTSIPPPTPKRKISVQLVGGVLLGVGGVALVVATQWKRPVVASLGASGRSLNANVSLVAAASGRLNVTNAAGRSGAFYVPKHEAQRRLPVLVAIHGTDSSGQDMVSLLGKTATDYGFAVIAPDSRRSPHGEWTWQVPGDVGETSQDLAHITAALREVSERFVDDLDQSKVLIAGFSGGASLAACVASRYPEFGAFAVLHGGVFPDGLGTHRVRGWFSTGHEDLIRDSAQVRGAMAATQVAGFDDLVFREFSGGHGLSSAELGALVEWWLDVDEPQVKQ